jgi:hypothetical protein
MVLTVTQKHNLIEKSENGELAIKLAKGYWTRIE